MDGYRRKNMPDIKSYVERIERLEEEKREVQQDIKDVYTEAKSNGFNKKALKAVIKLRKMDPDIRQELESDTQLYMDSLN